MNNIVVLFLKLVKEQIKSMCNGVHFKILHLKTLSHCGERGFLFG